MKKFCTKCGHEFESVGREVICPSCKQAAAEETKRAAVLRAKRASWTGESVPVRISGRASTVIREFGASHTMTFAESLDTLLRTSEYFRGTGVKWEDITPYKSRRRDKHTADATQAQDTAQDTAHEIKAASKASTAASKASASKASASKPQAAKATKAASKAKASTAKASK